jgi:hypothetical protein
MAFSQSGLLEVVISSDGPDLFIKWDSPAPQGTIFQVYVDHRLSWSGISRQCHAPVPAGVAERNVWIDVVSVDAGDAYRDFSKNLASLGQGAAKAQISWSGGTYLDSSGADNIQGFRIYRSALPGAPINWSSPVEEIPAYPGGWVSDGFGLGGFGLGGFGRSENTYVWTFGGLASGTWQIAVVPYDKAGNNRSAGLTVSVNLAASPLPPAPSTNGQRLKYTYSGPVTRQVTLNWLASPSS